MNDDISGWNEWSKVFADWTDVSISELHGLMTGLMTVCHAPSKIEDWEQLLTELSFSIPDEAALTLLAEEAEDTSFQLKDKDDAYQYSPLVPDDEHDLYERVMALKQWANGFMTGFGVTDCTLSAEETVMFSDLAKIGSIRIEPDDEFEGGEESYLYLYEFVRMVPVSLAIRPRKAMMSLPLIAGLSPDAKTAKELEQQGVKPKPMPPVIDIMNQNRPS
ncbi:MULTISPECIES: UPF0149 family protein [Psychrobacter]|uniref:UPF0149 family protein n=3 Tax=Psychrobacter TaxID=497 RepID=A0A844M260_9GAMM|nr:MULTISPECIES: UPF0149 family protein [Psychrobacter]MUG33042.1 UPF0149 family protein [Psychrobacter sanguinis]UNK04970.1 UPF0149 family protein [Psychrobacter sp. PraFG1]